MKYNKLLALAIASTNQIAIADRIENQFTPNETLTAPRMNEIRTAVNDNDANKQDNISSGCLEAQAIQDIKSNGDVDCIDIPQGGPSSGTTTDYYYISGSDLKPIEETAQIISGNIRWNTYDIDGQYGFPVTRGRPDDGHSVGHGVRLPHKSTVTDMRCYYYDNDQNYAITKFDFNLYERPFNDRLHGVNLLENAKDDDINTFDGRFAPSKSKTIHQLIAKPERSFGGSKLNHEIDNEKNQYYMRLRLATSSGYTSANSRAEFKDGTLDSRSYTSAIRTYGCRITYKR